MPFFAWLCEFDRIAKRTRADAGRRVATLQRGFYTTTIVYLTQSATKIVAMPQQPPFIDRRLWMFGAAAAALLAGCSTPVPRQSASLPPRATIKAASSLALDAAERESAVAKAMMVVNTPYRYGGNTIEGGFDCSGLVHYVFNDLGSIRLPRSTAQWAAASTPVPQGDLKRGDLVFFNTTGTPWSHMGIYVGNGQFVHAPSSGGTVRKDSLSNRYFAARYLGARSVFSEN